MILDSNKRLFNHKKLNKLLLKKIWKKFKIQKWLKNTLNLLIKCLKQKNILKTKKL